MGAKIAILQIKANDFLIENPFPFYGSRSQNWRYHLDWYAFESLRFKFDAIDDEVGECETLHQLLFSTKLVGRRKADRLNSQIFD